MKSLNLTLLLILSGLFAVYAQNYVAVGPNPEKHCTDAYTPSASPFSDTHLTTHQNYQSSVQNNNSGTRAVTSVPVGTAGNLFTIIDAAVNSLAADNDLGVVAFIHRTDPSVYPSNNVGQYRYDVSVDYGQTWSVDNGLLNPSGNQLTLAGRFPQAVIHNPLGNTVATNAYLSYQGTWLPFDQNGDWDGLFGGVARLDNDAATFTENVYNPYKNAITVATGLCNGVPNVFWSITTASQNGTSSDADSLILFKGTFDAASNDVSWVIDRFLVPGFDKSFDGDTRAASYNMAFDPTGQYGWVVMLSDITALGVNTLNPVVYKTVDGGNSWIGPETVDLSTIQNVVDSLQDPVNDVPTTAFDCDIVVDKYGNPHIAVVVGASSDYAIITNQSGTNVDLLTLYDITYDNSSSCKWQANEVADMRTFRGQITSDVSEDNRPQASLSPDGSKVFISWLDSDPNFTGGSNEIPDFFVKGFDVDNGLATPVVNWTLGDPVWSGGALFGTMSQNALEPTSGTYKLPVIFTQLNPLTGSDADPTSFHYVQDISYTDADFTLDYKAPEVTINGSNPVTVVSGTTYNDAGVTAVDNVDGTLSSGNIVVNNTVDNNTVGQYTVTYTAFDAAGNVSCEVTRVVNVVASPDLTPPTITLMGNDTITLEYCEFLTVPGATATDNVDGDITSNIQVTSNVDTGVVGFYTIDYDVTDGAGNSATTVTRVVELVGTPPSIILNGASSLQTEVCLGFNDPGASASNACGAMAVTVTSVPTFDINTIGIYTLTYTANDGVNPAATVTRTVEVTADATGPVITLLGDNPDLAYLGEPYSDPGATADDCVAGSVSVNATTANTSARDTVEVEYSATDGTNSSTTTRTVYVNTEPDPDFSFVVNQSVAGRVEFTDESRYNPTKWVWTTNAPGAGTKVTQNPTFNFTSNGVFEVCLEVENDWNAAFNKPKKQICKDVEIIGVGIEEAQLREIFTLYPNPTEAIVNINYSGFEFKSLNISIFNMVGKEIINKNYSQAPNAAKIKFDLSGNADGVYLVRIQTDKGVITEKISLFNK